MPLPHLCPCVSAARPAIGADAIGAMASAESVRFCLPCREGFVGLPVADTIKLCLRLGLKDQATKLARDFKVG